MKNARQRLGGWGEAYAMEYLQTRGCMVLERNARTPYGEIDLVAVEAGQIKQTSEEKSGSGRVILFVEVKTRSSTSYGYPEQAITKRKREHLLAAAEAYLQAHPELEGDWRIDVMAIYRPDPRQPAIVDYFENAVRDE